MILKEFIRPIILCYVLFLGAPQIDYLQQKNAELQTRCVSAENREQAAMTTTSSLDNRNLELESELQTVDRMAQRLQLDRESTVKAADREINEAKVHLSLSLRFSSRRGGWCGRAV